MNLAVAVSDASIEAVKATQASVTHDRNDRRVAAAAGFAAAGFGGGAVAGFAGAGSRESSLLIGISQKLRTNKKLKLLQRFQ